MIDAGKAGGLWQICLLLFPGATPCGGHQHVQKLERTMPLAPLCTSMPWLRGHGGAVTCSLCVWCKGSQGWVTAHGGRKASTSLAYFQTGLFEGAVVPVTPAAGVWVEDERWPHKDDLGNGL